MEDFQVVNKYMVGAMNRGIAIGRPTGLMSYDDAILLAAFLVAMAEPFSGVKFEDVLKKVTES